MAKIAFRPCTPDDIKQAVALIYSAGPQAFDIAFSDAYEDESLAFLHRAFSQSGTEFSFDQHLAMTRDGQIVGVGGIKTATQTAKFTFRAALAIFRFYPLLSACRTVIRGLNIEKVIKPPKKHRAMIHNLAVTSNHRGEGLGTQLVEYLEKQMLEQGFTIAALDVDGNNPRAKALYEKLGYSVRKERTGLLKGRFTKPVTMTSFYMEKELKKQGN